MRRIYVASSWRNDQQPLVVSVLRSAGHLVYDFRENEGFHWSEIDTGWKAWSPQEYIRALGHPLAKKGFQRDFEGMEWADTFVLVTPCGASSHLEIGWAIGQGKFTIALPPPEPELMYKLVDRVCASMNEVLELLS